MASHFSSYSTSNRGRGRGGGRGRGSGRGYWRDDFRQVPTVDQLPPKPLGPTIDSIDIKTLMTEEDTPTIKEVEYVASYNWLNGESPTILVPGSPPAWTPPVTDTRLKRDSGDVFRDINSARYPSYPLEPTFRSLKAMKPDYDLRDVDIVGCGSTIGNLMRFARSERKPFRFDVERVGDTVLFVRKENSPGELIADLQGYGHTFPEAYTTWDPAVRDSCSHQRVVGYDFGGLKFLVRTETDGYVKSGRSGQGGPINNSRDLSPPFDLDPISPEILDDVLRSVALTTGMSTSQDQDLKVRMRGEEIPQSQIFDIKTRANYKTFNMEEILPRLWLNQTPNFLLAYHKFGLFDKPDVKNVKEDVLKWEKDNSSVLALFHAVVKRIVDVMLEETEELQCEVSWDGQGRLYITEAVGERKKALPSDLAQIFEG
ncbi:hypothetical protein FQN54_000738 [Arachnomyces sp. PD_36]|nr:hypothetical protein FQN54_000738 [Arachnomyces sp. PD_36]